LTERTLVLILLVSAILSAFVMWVVQTHIGDTREKFGHVGLDSPDALNYLLQSDHNLDQFIDAVRELQLSPANDPSRELKAQQVRDRYDVLWSSASIFFMQFPIDQTPDIQVEAYLATKQNFLNTFEPFMAADVQWSDQDLRSFVEGAKEIAAGIRSLGQGYFVFSTKQSDISHQQLEQLNGYMRLFIGLLVVTGGLGVGLLARSNYRTSMMFEQAQEARSELATTVDELRSGRREQRSKDSFIASASHDLRQPLHALGLFLNSLRTEIKPTGELALNEAMQCTEALNRLFTSMLDLSRLDAGVVVSEPEDFDLHRLLNTLHRELSPSASGNGISLSFDGPEADAHTDPILLTRIVRNLVDNAITHSEATELLIEHKAARNGYEIIVSDNGRGIPIDEQSEIFSEYYQLDNPERDRSKGLGLGLSIVRRLSELLGVELQLESEPGKGTTFTIWVPAGKEERKTEARHQASGMSSICQGAVIVVIDDDVSILNAMEIMLKNAGVHVVCAESVDGALEQLAEHSWEPDLIVADYRLRDHLRGDAVIHQLREACEHEIPGLIITGDTSPQRVSEASATGFELLHKPVEAEVLQEKINDMLSMAIPA